MVWVLFLATAVLVMGVTAALMTGRLSADPVPPPVSTTPSTNLRDDLVAADIDDIRFDTALRGYRMDQVDDVLDRLYHRVAGLEQELGRRREPVVAPVDRPHEPDLS